PPATTPTEEIPNATNPAPPPPNAPAYTSASGPDTTGEDLASLIQGFADDTRNRGRLRMTLRGMVDVLGNPAPATPGGNPRDQMTTTQGPLYGYPWVTPVPGAKSPGQLDAGNTSTTSDPKYTASSKPVFFPDD